MLCVVAYVGIGVAWDLGTTELCGGSPVSLGTWPDFVAGLGLLGLVWRHYALRHRNQQSRVSASARHLSTP
jgi:hypothetical protein